MRSRVVFAASSGGHLHQLHVLARGFAAGTQVWLTDRSAQSESLLGNERVFWVRPIVPRDIAGVILALPSAFRATRSASLVVSTGASIAVTLALASFLRGIRMVYVESATRTHGPSLSGKLVALFPHVILYTQHRRWEGGRWRFAGSVFDDFEVRERRDALSSARVCAFVTVGLTRDYPLTGELRSLAQKLPDEWETSWQWGAAALDPEEFPGRATMTHDEIGEHLSRADVVISHAGTGSLLAALEAGKVPYLCPRIAVDGGHVDDHQQYTARFAAEHGLAEVGQFASPDIDAILSTRGREAVRRSAHEGLLQRIFEVDERVPAALRGRGNP